MGIVKEKEIELCTFCKGSKFRKIPSEQGHDLRKCVKCGSVTDFKIRAEDEKHRVYHDTGKEPDDKMKITDEDKKSDS